jgi:hypothetical protein
MRKGGQQLYSNTKRVVEYLVLERRMWYADAPWIVREQIYEGVKVRTTSV